MRFHRTAPFLSIVLLLVAVSPVFAQKLEWRDTYAKALQDAGEQGKLVFVFVTGSQWSKPCREYKQLVIESGELARLFGDKFIGFEIDVPDMPTEARKKTIDDQKKGFDVTVRNYPGVVLLDGESRMIMKREGVDGGLRTLNRAIREALAKKDRRDVFLEKAQKAEGDEKAKQLAGALELLGKSSIHGGNSHRKIFDELKKLDPEDKLGTQRRLDFNVDAFAERSIWPLTREKKYDEALELIAKELTDSRNDKELRQRFTAMRFFVYQEQKELDKAVQTLNQLIAIDEKSYMAELARGYISNITDKIVLEGPAWEPKYLRFFFATWHLDAKKLVPEGGEYEIHFERTQHENISVQDVAFFIGGKEVARVDMPGGKDRVVIAIPEFRPNTQREFQIRAKGNGWFGSRGRINVTKK